MAPVAKRAVIAVPVAWFGARYERFVGLGQSPDWQLCEPVELKIALRAADVGNDRGAAVIGRDLE